MLDSAEIYNDTRKTKLAIDIGGTFTDFALEHRGQMFTAKVLTTPQAPEQAVLAGVASILATSGIAAEQVDLLIHGTTLATNAVIERKGARTAVVTTEGFRDVLAMRNESRYDQYDLNIVLPEPLVPRHLRFTVPERLDHLGRVLRPLDEQAVRDLVPRLRQEEVESIAVGFLHAFVNPAHERRVGELLAEAMPDVPISLSSEVSPEMREWERFSTTAANAYVQPMMARYLRRLESGMREMGLHAPIFLMLSGGKLTTIETACRFPIRLVESGPAGGAIFSATIAREAGLERVLSFDMGGTTAKVCLIDDFKPQTSRSFEVARIGRLRKGSGLPLRIPVIEMVEIGAGGGSIASVDPLGRVAVGPESAGAAPGPASYGRGGTAPTVTDSNLLLGRYDATAFAGGTIMLDAAAARRALDEHVGARLELSSGMAALAVVEIVDEAMANAGRVHAIEAGTALAGRTLIAFGGGGPVHATRIAEKMGMDRVLVPNGAGVGSAIGFLRAPVGYEVVRSLYQRLNALDLAAVNALLDDMAREASEAVAAGAFGAKTVQTRIATMRYVGQGHEILVALPVRSLVPEDAAAIMRDYEAAYARFYDRPVPGSEVEVLSYIVTVETEAPPPQPPDTAVTAYTAEAHTSRVVRDSASGVESVWPIFNRFALELGATMRGPAIIAETETSTLLGPGWQAAVTAQGWLSLTRATSELA
jgi:N-methylhydantoinase A